MTASTWAQSTRAQISEVTNADTPPATAENSRPVYQLDRSEEDWSSLCRQVNGRGDLFTLVHRCVFLRKSRVVLSSVATGAPGPRSMRTNLTSASCFSS